MNEEGQVYIADADGDAVRTVQEVKVMATSLNNLEPKYKDEKAK